MSQKKTSSPKVPFGVQANELCRYIGEDGFQKEEKRRQRGGPQQEASRQALVPRAFGHEEFAQPRWGIRKQKREFSGCELHPEEDLEEGKEEKEERPQFRPNDFSSCCLSGLLSAFQAALRPSG